MESLDGFVDIFKFVVGCVEFVLRFDWVDNELNCVFCEVRGYDRGFSCEGDRVIFCICGCVLGKCRGCW